MVWIILSQIIQAAKLLFFFGLCKYFLTFLYFFSKNAENIWLIQLFLVTLQTEIYNYGNKARFCTYCFGVSRGRTGAHRVQ